MLNTKLKERCIANKNIFQNNNVSLQTFFRRFTINEKKKAND